MKSKTAKTAAKAAAPSKSKSKPNSVCPILRATLPGLSYSTHQIAFSPDGKFLASGGHGDGHRLWFAPDFKRFHKLGDDDNVVCDLAFTADSKRLAIASTGERLTVWDTASGKNLHTIKVKGLSRGVAFSPDGKWLALAAGRSVLVWDAAKGGEPAMKLDFKAIVETVAFHADGRLVVKAGKLVTIGTPWAAGGRALSIESKGSPMSVTLSPDGATLLAAGGKSHAQLFDASTGEPGLTLGGLDLDGSVYYASLSPDGRRILTSDSDANVRIWDASTGALQTTWTGPDDGCTAGACFSPDGRLVAAQYDVLRVYEASAGDDAEPLASLPFIADEGCLEFSPDGKFLAAGSDSALMVWAI
jgi:WD40 repeat protein